MNTASTSGSGSLPRNTVANPRSDLKAITTRSGVSYDGPPIPPPFSSLPKVVEQEPEVTKDTVQPSTKHIQPPVVQTCVQIDEPFVSPKPKLTIPYPSRANKQKLREKDDNLASKFVEIFRELHFELSFADALLHMPKFALMFKKLVECLALADLGASINLMPLSIWENLSLPELTPTQMILELADRSTTRPARIAEDVFVKVGKFHFPADFVVVDYIVNPRVPLILKRHFLRKARALIDVYGEELTLRVDDEAITFKVGQTSRYSYNNSESVNRIDVIDVSCEEYAKEVLVKASNVDSSEIASAVASAVTSAMTAMFKQHQVTPAPAFVKVVEESCVTCGGAHSYRQCPATDGNTFLGYQDNIQGYVSAAAVNYNQGNTGYRPQSIANQFRPPGFAQPNVQNQGFNQNRGNNFNQGNTSYQAPIQTQVTTSSDLEKFKKTNEASMQAMRNHISNLKSELRNEMQSTMQNQNNTFKNEMRNEMQATMSNQTNELKNMMASFFQMNTASSSGTGSLPSNTVANPRGDLKAITNRTGISYDGPPIPPPFSPLPKEMEREPEVTKDTVQPSTKNIQPLVVQIQAPIDEPVVAPKLKLYIPYLSRANKQKLHEKDDNLASKFVEIFMELHFELSFADALFHMPKFASMFKSLLNNKEKLFDLVKTPGMVECSALANLGASINLMRLSVWKKLSLPELTSTRMTLKLTDRSITRPKGVIEDVFVKVGKFHYPADFVVVDYDADPRVPLILGRPFIRMARALIDVYGEEITLRFNDEAITFKVGQTSRYSYNNSESVNQIDVIDISCDEYAQEVLKFSDSSTSGNPTPSLDPILSTYFPSLTPFEGGDFILEACLINDSIPPGINDADFDPEGDLLLLEKLLNDDPSSPLPLKELHFEELKTIKSSIDDPPELELKDLPSHLEYAFLEGTDKLPVIISKELNDEEKAALLKVLKSHKRAIAWKISDIKGIDPS
ncbi:reverse transcriptase domain-containing protein [Tanacetum coccineum]|uniref:Reverse transcriptase domain-containing protein n=1 Tax=Tanacetum coccineum TaxID=301880 RepID=A0ABQ5I0J8_9ASTR